MLPETEQQEKCEECGKTECLSMPPCDVTILCGDRAFPAHKEILKKSSVYFQEYFLATAAETGIVHLTEIDGSTFEAIFHFLYTSCTSKIKNNVFSKVLEASRFLGIDELYAFCWDAMKEKLDVDYFADLWTFGEAYEEEESLMEIKHFIASKFVYTSRTTDFFKLEGRQIQSLLRHPQWHGSSDGALVAVIQWTKYDLNKRQNELQNIVMCIDLHTITNLNLGLLLADDVILNAMFHLELKDTVLSLCAQRFNQTDQPEPMKGHSLVCFFRIVDNIKMFERTIFHLEEDTWVIPEDIPFILHNGVAIVSFQGCVYCFGGSTYNHVTVPTVYQYNPVMNVIYATANLKIPVFSAAVGSINDQLYVVGGLKGATCYEESSIVQRYDPVTRTTTVVSSLCKPCPDPSVVAICNNLYVVEKTVFNLQRYDVNHDQWSIIVCPNPFEVCQAVVWNRNLFIVYEENLNAIEVEFYDSITGEWKKDTIANECFDVNGVWYLSKGIDRSPLLVFHRGSGIKLYDPMIKLWTNVNMPCRLTGVWQPELTILV